MKITDAIKTAESEHVVYFLVAAYTETLDYYDPVRSCIPPSVKHLPLTGASDVATRFSALRAALQRPTPSQARHTLEEALAVFATAAERLSMLQAAPPAPRVESRMDM